MSKRLLFSLTTLLALLLSSPSSRAQTTDFDSKVAPLLAAKCLECHSGSKPKGGLNLAKRDLATKGGEIGAAIVSGNADKSLLWQRVRDDEMPPKHPLTKKQKQILKDWITGGAKWGTSPIDRFRYTTESRAGYDWWSLQPIRNVTPPESKDDDWSRNKIDWFVLKRLRHAELKPSKPADPRTLIRRVYFDLIGLPPSPDVVKKFVADPSDDHYQRIVNDLLSSHRYGERWGRHWLDVVRFGESNGFERNGPRYNFWHYRDWVIKALNNDMPYDEFVRMQLIGDLLKTGREGAASIGFLVAGVHNTVVGGSERMKKLARQDEFEEVIGTIGQTFLGLTVNCSRCHDHKFDPIKQTEYYQLISAIAGMNHGERVERTPQETKQLASLSAEVDKLFKQLSEIDNVARKAILLARKSGKAKPATPPKPFAQWNFDGDLRDSVGKMHGKIVGSAKLENGTLVLDGKSYVQTAVIEKTFKEKTLEAWVQLETLEQSGGGAISLEFVGGSVFDSIVFAELEKNRWMAGSNGFVRTDSFRANEEKDAVKRPVHVAIVYQADGTIIGYRDGKPYGRPIKKSGLQTYEAKKAHVLFGLRHHPANGNHFLKAKIHKASLYDRALSPGAVAASAGTNSDYVPEDQILAFLTPEARKQRAELKKRLAQAQEKHKKQSDASNQKMYTMNPGKPDAIRFLERGDIKKEGDLVAPGAVAAVKGVDATFQLSETANDAARRRKLADWITNSNNPLFARVVVNRVWQYHFGTGIVVTPSDFGFNGGLPSHPELIDWLAAQLKSNEFRLKSLHRLIVTSSTYRQASTLNASAQKKDADNRLLWRINPRRLEAESVRDSMLQVAEKLNLQMGGPGYVDVEIVPNNGTTYYEPKDVDGDAFFRRTVYRFTPRGGRSALLDTFDCPDPATTAPRRAITTTPLQALSLLNNAFVIRMSKYFAARVAKEKKDVAAQVDRAWQLAIARLPNKTERDLSIKLVQEHGLASLCRGLFNASEFVIVE